MTEARVTQLGQKGIVQNEGDARVTQEAVKSVVAGPSSVRATQLAAQLIAQADPDARVTRMFLQSIVKVKPARTPGRARHIQTATTSDRLAERDPYWNNVALLINGDSGLRDRSKYHAPGVGCRAHGPIIDPNNPRFGASLYCDSTNGNGMRVYPPDARRYALGNKPFTIEAWVRAPSSGNSRGIVGVYTTSNNNRGWSLLLAGNVITFYASLDGTAADLQLSGTSISANTWTHICVERDRLGKVRMYVNGVMVSSSNFPDRINAPFVPLSVMKYDHEASEVGGRCLNGFVNDIRVTKGVARYGTDAGFDVPTAAYPYKPFDETPWNSDPYWDKVTCLINCEQDPIVDLARGAEVTGITQRTLSNEANPTNRIVSGSGAVAHVDSQWDWVGRPEPFTFEWDVNCDRGGNPSPTVWTIAGCFRNYVTRGGITIQYWNGSGWVTAWSFGHYYSGLDNGTRLQTICITRDEYGVWRCWQCGYFRGSMLQPSSMQPTPETDLTINNGGSAYLDNIRMTWGVARYKNEGHIEGPEHALPYPLSGPPYTPPEVEVAYPFDLGFPDPKDGVNGWRSLAGTIPDAVIKYASRVPDSEDRDWFRWLAGASTRVRNETFLPIPEAFHEDVDAGNVVLEFGGLGASAVEQDDVGSIIATAHPNFTPSIYGCALSNAVDAKEFSQLQGSMPIPPGTRIIGLGFLAYRSGSSTSFVYRDVFARLVQAGADGRTYLPTPAYILDSSNNADLEQWTDAKGGDLISYTSDWGLPVPTTVGKTMDLRSEVELPSSFFVEIDDGEAAFGVEMFVPLATGDTNDFGRLYVEFLDADDELVGRRKWDAATPYIPSILQRVVLEAPIPATARKAVVGIFGSKDYAEAVGSSNITFTPSMYRTYCWVPEPEEMPAAPPEPPVLTEDEHWDKVAFLLSTRNGVIENLANNEVRSIAVTGSVAVETIASPFGTTALGCNLAAAANNSHYVDVSMFGLSYGPKMTFEGWFMKTGHSRSNATIHNQLGYGTDATTVPLSLMGGGSPTLRADTQLAFNEWYHVALCRDETGRGVLFVNGKKQAAVTDAYAALWSNVFRLFYNTNWSGENSWIGYVDELRITNGVERYTEDFTPPEQRWPVGPSDLPELPDEADVAAAWGVDDLAAIYSLRLTVPEYTGPLVTGIRVSDGARQDFYAGDDGWIDVAEVAAWANGSDVAVYRWYDQSANGRHANGLQYSGDNLPLLATAGSVAVRGGVPFIQFGAANLNTKTWLLLPFNVFKSPHTIIYTGQRTNNLNNGVWAALFSGALSSNGLGMGYASALTPSLMCNGNSDSTGGTAHPLNTTVVNAWKASAAYAGGTYSVTPYVNKVASSVRSLNYSTRTLADDFTYVGGAAGNDASCFVGFISEIVITLSALSDPDREAIENRMVVQKPALESDFTDPVSVGDRTGIVAVSLVNIGTAGGGLPGLVDGSQGNNWWFNSGTGDGTGYILFDLGEGGEKIIDGFRWYQHNSASHGTWVLEGSNDNDEWTATSPTFTLGGLNTTEYWFGTNDQAYRYYRLRHLSGNRSDSPYDREIEFRIVPTTNAAPAARYWRVWGNSPRGDYLSVGEIELRGTPGGADLTGTGVAIESGHYGGQVAANAFDDNPASYWESSQSNTNKWVGYDFGDGNDVAVNEISLTTAPAYDNEVPAMLRVDFSHDGVTWSPMWMELDIPAWPLNEERVFTNPFYDPAPHTAPAARYWRIRGAAQGSNIMAVGELEFRAAPGGADLTGSGTPLSSSDYNSAHQKAYAFDNNPSNKWASTDTPFGKWIGYDFGDGNDVTVNEVAVSARNDGALEQSPLRFWVEHSDDGVTWTKLWSVKSVPAWSLGETRAYTNPGYEE